MRAHAVLLGERLERRGRDADGAVTAAPLSFKVGEAGLVVLFRYGVVVMFGLGEAQEIETLAGLADRVVGPEPTL
jgi:uncharacterized Rmd1/YagE family protein